MRLDEDPSETIAAYRELIRDNIGYDDLLIAHPHDRELVEGIADLILETMISRKEYILIASSSYPAEIVKAKLMKLKYSHIEYILFCMERNTTKVNNIKKYLLAVVRHIKHCLKQHINRNPFVSVTDTTIRLFSADPSRSSLPKHHHPKYMVAHT